MGNRHSVFTHDEMEFFVLNTFLNKGEVHRLFKKWTSMGGRKESKLNVDVIGALPEWKHNPWKSRIMHVFSEGSGSMSFYDFLVLYSAFHDRAPRLLKEQIGFKLYDFEEDDQLTEEDIYKAIRISAGESLRPEQAVEAAKQVIKEVDVDGNGRVAFPEFQKIIKRIPDFRRKFVVRF